LELALTSETGVVHELQEKLERIEARRDGTSIEHGGTVFRDQRDFEALLATIDDTEFYRYFLDIYSMLNLSQNAFDTYDKGIKAEADAIKANYTSVNSSRIKLSFQVAYPEPVMYSSKTPTGQAQGGTKWSAAFASAEIFDDEFRRGTHKRMLDDVETVYNLTQRAIDYDFPLKSKRIINAILSHQLRLAYQGTVGYLNCLLPFYKTCKRGGHNEQEGWDRARVMSQEFFDDVQSRRQVSSKFTCSDLCWGAMVGTDRVEEYRRENYIEHPKITSILALTSMEKEGNAASEVLSALKSEKDKTVALTSRMTAAEKKLNNLKDKNSNLNW